MEDSRIPSIRILPVGVLAALLSSSCSYHNANLNFTQLAERNVYIASHPPLSADARSYGEVEVTRRFLYGWPCSMSASSTLDALRKAAFDRGANLVIDVE